MRYTYFGVLAGLLVGGVLVGIMMLAKRRQGECRLLCGPTQSL